MADNSIIDDRDRMPGSLGTLSPRRPGPDHRQTLPSVLSHLSRPSFTTMAETVRAFPGFFVLKLRVQDFRFRISNKISWSCG